jgi:UDP-4-amino-4,6-dideoxy-N-acetyl-beta-L-altrosamine N-acetyltransferase
MIEKFGIQLEPLTLDTAMIVRQWRNSPKVSQFMDFKEQISEEQQIRWFENTVRSENKYFILKQNSISIGLIHLDRFNEIYKSAFAGLFIGNESFEGTGIAFKASIALLEYAFEELKLKKVFAKVHQNNGAAIAYNSNLGFEFDGTESDLFLRLKITPDSFYEYRTKLMNLLSL